MSLRYAHIIIDISIKSLDRVFTYGIPDHMALEACPGAVVEIPFGNGNKIRNGYILEVVDHIDFDPSKLKYIKNVLPGMRYEGELLDLAAWMQRRYACTIQTALKALLPTQPGVKKKEEFFVQSLLSPEAIEGTIASIRDKPIHRSRVRVLECLYHQPFIKQAELLTAASVSAGVLQTMEKRGLIERTYKRTQRIPYDVDDYATTTNLRPNLEQQEAIDGICEAVEAKKREVFLLHGVTGSGKTEVYMQVIEQVLKAGKSAIVLIPEIGLTPQALRRFVERFGDVVGVMHSRLSVGERFDQWQLAKDGAIKIMIGPRSAIFTPFESIGVIIIDEEHETTYKSEMPPKFHAREVAVFRANRHGCPVVLGSATPLVSTMYKALSGIYKKYELNEKAASDQPLEVITVDMRKELAEGNKTIFSQALRQRIQETLLKKEQVILFLNRRGYAKFVSCRQCGYVIKCDHCDVPLNYHKHRHQLLCHYCGNSQPMVQKCPSCGSQHIREFGVGTQKVEDMILQVFPEARILRMDYDTTSGKHGHTKVLDSFENYEADILLGTQMVAKGHHFDRVTLVGVLAADMSLYTNDFRASERTFQLITQVIGRSGRGTRQGSAVIQTYSPDHYSITCAANEDYDTFYRNEIAYRELMGYEPFKHMLLVMMTSKDEKYIIRLSYQIAQRLGSAMDDNDIEILGPTQASLSKINDHFRRVIYIKSSNYNLLTGLSEWLYDVMKEEDYRKIGTIAMDINPMMAY